MLRSDNSLGVVKGGSSVGLFCETNSISNVTEWFLNGERLNVTDSDQFTVSNNVRSLHIQTFQHKLNGEFRCMVENILSSPVQLWKASK